MTPPEKVLSRRSPRLPLGIVGALRWSFEGYFEDLAGSWVRELPFTLL